MVRRNCLLKHVIEGKIDGRIEMKGRRERSRKQLLYDLKEARGYWTLKGEAVDRTLCRTRFGHVGKTAQTMDFLKEKKGFLEYT
jgi:hypothetical protein